MASKTSFRSACFSKLRIFVEIFCTKLHKYAAAMLVYFQGTLFLPCLCQYLLIIHLKAKWLPDGEQMTYMQDPGQVRPRKIK